MKVEIRKTAQGTEYWDTKEKRTLFVPAGKKPHFEVTKNPETMLTKDGKKSKTAKITKGKSKSNDAE
jgi:hypothetical protein